MARRLLWLGVIALCLAYVPGVVRVGLGLTQPKKSVA